MEASGTSGWEEAGLSSMLGAVFMAAVFLEVIGGFHQNLKCVYRLMQQFHLYARETRTQVRKERWTTMCVVTLFVIVQCCKQVKYLSTGRWLKKYDIIIHTVEYHEVIYK